MSPEREGLIEYGLTFLAHQIVSYLGRYLPYLHETAIELAAERAVRGVNGVVVRLMRNM